MRAVKGAGSWRREGGGLVGSQRWLEGGGVRGRASSLLGVGSMHHCVCGWHLLCCAELLQHSDCAGHQSAAAEQPSRKRIGRPSTRGNTSSASQQLQIINAIVDSNEACASNCAYT